MWFILDGDDIVFNTGASSSKGKAVRRDPRVCLTVDLPAPPYAFVQAQGVASVSDDVAAMLPYTTAIAGRYMGADRAEEFARRNAVPGELLVRVTITKVNSALDLTG